MGRPNTRLLLACVTAQLLLGLAVRPVEAAIVRDVSLGEMTRSSERVLRGEVLTTRARYDAATRRIWTYVALEVHEVLAGSALVKGARMTIVTPGGEVGGYAQHVPGAPAFRAGEEVVVFCERTRAGLQAHTLAMGRFDIERGGPEPIARSVRRGLLVMPDARRAPRAATEFALPLVRLREIVRAEATR